MSKRKKVHRVDKHSPKERKILPGKLLGIIAVAGILLLVVGSFILFGDDNNIPDNFVPEVTGSPRVAVAQEVVDYGDVKLNTTVQTVFEVQNVGDESLSILGEPRVELVEGC